MSKRKSKRNFSIFDDPYYSLGTVASATDYTGIAPSLGDTPANAAVLAGLAANRSKNRSKDKRFE